MYFAWDPEYNMGIKEIDDQHKIFVGILDKLYDLILASAPREELGRTLEELIEYALNHFETEEKYFDMFNFSGAAEHKTKHKELKEKILNFKIKFKSENQDVSVELIDFLEDWLVDHLLNLDKKYVDCFHEHGLK